MLKAYEGLLRSYSMPGLSYNSILGKFMVFTTDAEVRARRDDVSVPARHPGQPRETIDAGLELKGQHPCSKFLPTQLALAPMISVTLPDVYVASVIAGHVCRVGDKSP